MKNFKTPNIIVLFCLILGLNSCLSRRNQELIYFKSVKSDVTVAATPYPKPNIIKPGDYLQLTIFCLDDRTCGIFNNTAGSAGTASNGFLVNDSGNIILPLLGIVKATGLDKNSLADTIILQLERKRIAIKPIVTVKINNFKITFLGEVGHPGVINVQNEHITITEALAMAGDITIYGNRERILLIREIDGKRTSKRFSLNNDEIFSSEFYYLQNQDIIYIESTKVKATPLARFSTNFSIVITSVSFFLLLYTTSRTF